MKGSTALALMAAALAAGAAQAAVSESEAIAIATKDAGADGAVITASSTATVDGKAAREVFFETDDAGYRYVINVETGEVLKREARSSDATSGATKKVRARALDIAAADGVGPDKAKSIALSHAGVAEGDAARMKVKTKRRDGASVYEVEFKSKGFEYEYDIAANGDVLSWEKEPD